MSFTRRRFVQGSAVLATASQLPALARAAQAAHPRPAGRRLPVIFVGHGSPRNAIEDNAFTARLAAWGRALPRPGAILSVSAHWLTPGSTNVQVQAAPRTLHDFGGFAQALYDIDYPAPGHPALALGTRRAVRAAQVQATESWGLDHGTWTVLHRMFLRADVPVFQLSIDYARPAAFHYAVGRDLAALRDQGVLVMGSGNIAHNLRATMRGYPAGPRAGAAWAQSLDDAVRDALAQRDDRRLLDYARLPGADMAIATPDHYFPFLYALGAAGDRELPRTVFEGFQSGTISMRCLQFGA